MSKAKMGRKARVKPDVRLGCGAFKSARNQARGERLQNATQARATNTSVVSELSGKRVVTAPAGSHRACRVPPTLPLESAADDLIKK